MEGYPHLGQVLERLSYHEQEYLRLTVLSEQAKRVMRFGRQTAPGYCFPYEGHLAGHTEGTLIRGQQLRELDRMCRQRLRLPEHEVCEDFAILLEGAHDSGEFGEQGDIPHGAKNDIHRKIEAQQFATNIALVRHLPTWAKLLRVQEISERNGESVEGRLWKLSEHLGFLEIARRMYRRDLLGEVVNDAEENEQGIYVRRTDQFHQNGEPQITRLRKPHTVVYDIVKNSPWVVMEFASEFPAARVYLAKHREELRQMNDVFLSRPEDIAWLQRELRQLDPTLPKHSVDFVLARHDEYDRYLRTVRNPLEPKISAQYTELANGIEVRIDAVA